MVEIIGTLLGVVFGGLVGYLVSSAESRRLARSNAALQLRDAFKPELLALNPAHSKNSSDVPALLQAAFDRHRTAVFDFSWYLPSEEQARFNQAWRSYYAHEDLVDQDSIPFFEQYSTRGLDLGQTHEKKKLARSRIEAILDYAKPKTVRSRINAILDFGKPKTWIAARDNAVPPRKS